MSDLWTIADQHSRESYANLKRTFKELLEPTMLRVHASLGSASSFRGWGSQVRFNFDELEVSHRSTAAAGQYSDAKNCATVARTLGTRPYSILQSDWLRHQVRIQDFRQLCEIVNA
ncbi:hypothetical protein OUZ56_025500 [Daphnia magna]|uniref:Uncharacterized protein n=1 Tax=Daphnia magna TaxID=35525 RepID=A0ABQ9ZK17_9CRUS|nr:hypothetical protein OUZ56_025500 [Daphnia magna]